MAVVLAAIAAAGFAPGERVGSAGVSLRAPAGWIVWSPRRPTDGVTNPVLRVALVGPRGTVIQVRELVAPLLRRGSLATFPRRPADFAVRALRPTAGCVLPGSVGTSFRERGRAFYVFVQHPRPVVEAVLDSLRVESR